MCKKQQNCKNGCETEKGNKRKTKIEYWVSAKNDNVGEYCFLCKNYKIRTI